MYTNNLQTTTRSPQVQVSRPMSSRQTQAQAPAPAPTVRPDQSRMPAHPPAWERQYDRWDDIWGYPYIQWVTRGDLLIPQQPVGGFAVPVDLDIQIPGIYAEMVHPESTTPVIYAPELEIAVVRRRFAWIDPATRVRLPGYRPGARGRTQYLGFVRQVDPADRMIMLTFTGMAGVFFEQARQEFARAIRKATGGKAPAYAFWMRVVAGEPILVGKHNKAPISPPVWAGEPLSPDLLDSLFVGDEILGAIDWEAVDRWVSWGNGSNGKSTGGAFPEIVPLEVEEEVAEEWGL